jgi:DtxR family manganese transport transcriptional regulator
MASKQQGSFGKTRKCRPEISCRNPAKTRRDNSDEIAQDLVEAIADLIAEVDAEGIEHHVSPETLAVFERLLKRRS